MSWYISAKSNSEIGSFNRRIKDFIRKSPFFRKLFSLYGVPMDRLDDLVFKVKKLHGKYATSNSKEIWINKKLFENGDFFDDKVHFVVHEIVHWLTRQREKECYFADPEETQAFIHSMCWELLRGKDKTTIFKTFYPIIEAHFNKEENAAELFDLLFEKACAVLSGN
jgi:hypothetical protein